MHGWYFLDILLTFEDIWGHLGIFGDIWGHLGTFGDMWGYVGTWGAWKSYPRNWRNHGRRRRRKKLILRLLGTSRSKIRSNLDLETAVCDEPWFVWLLGTTKLLPWLSWEPCSASGAEHNKLSEAWWVKNWPTFASKWTAITFPHLCFGTLVTGAIVN